MRNPIGEDSSRRPNKPVGRKADPWPDKMKFW